MRKATRKKIHDLQDKIVDEALKLKQDHNAARSLLIQDAVTIERQLLHPNKGSKKNG